MYLVFSNDTEIRFVPRDKTRRILSILKLSRVKFHGTVDTLPETATKDRGGEYIVKMT